jgi:hypothetical protein
MMPRVREKVPFDGNECYQKKSKALGTTTSFVNPDILTLG